MGSVEMYITQLEYKMGSGPGPRHNFYLHLECDVFGKTLTAIIVWFYIIHIQFIVIFNK